MKFTVYFEIFGKKMRTIIEATSEEDAKYQVMGKIKWHKFERRTVKIDDDPVGFFEANIWNEMILTFSKQQFVDRILSGVKIHTIREDSHNRWKPGRLVQFWFGNPRNTRGKVRPYHFANGVCEHVDPTQIYYEQISFEQYPHYSYAIDIYTPSEFIDSVKGRSVLNRLAINDGFNDYHELFAWFEGKIPFTGKLIWFKVTEKLI